MNNDETNYEFVNRDCENVISGNEKKIQFYSKTYESIYDKYKNWRTKRIEKNMIDKENQIYKINNIIDKGRLSVRDERLIIRKREKLKDEVEYLNLALVDEHYLHVNVRLLKVAGRAKNSICRWWKDFIKGIPIVGKMYEKHVVANDEHSEAQNSELNVDDIISPESVSKMIDNQFQQNDSQENITQMNNNSDDAISPESINRMIDNQFQHNDDQEDRASVNSDSDVVISPDAVDKMISDRFGYSDSQNVIEQKKNVSSDDFKNSEYRFGRAELADMPGRFDFIGSSDSNETKNEVMALQSNSSDTSTELRVIPDEVTSLSIPDEFKINLKSETDGSTIDTSIIDDKDTIEELQQYKEIIKRQAAKRREMSLKKQKVMDDYKKAQEKNNEVRDQHSYLTEMISSRLNAMENDLNLESQKTQEELSLVRSKTDKLNSDTTKLGLSNESLKAMCDELNIGVQEKSNVSSKGR